ncbi:uncharacterized protein TNIN_128641 [Trichonephila inaurata madagascariensis]|uniref:Monocarboxylate transporter n=1 Tax=Trichonephila inaurata madagascariensis TaxID=2747483 RepID=A0A8X6XXA6_9ARAC|nr:uncharacterized protein TNIN_128641 [Trichonephila inaurata madagascariensis]
MLSLSSSKDCGSGCPLIGYLGAKFGIKTVITCGSFMSSIAVFLCFFAENIIAITILWGLIFGFCFGLGCVLVPQVMKNHFSNHLDKAIGLTIAGECVIYLPLTLLTEYSLKTYDYSGTFLMLSGALMHTLPVCLVLSILDQPRSNSLRTVESADSLNEHETKLNQNSFEEHSVPLPSEVPNESVVSAVSGLKLFIDPVFFVIMLTQSLLLYVNIAILTIFVDISRDHGVLTEDEVYPLIGFAVADAIGRIFLGLVTDGGYLSKMNFSALCFAAVGFLIIAFVWIKGFAMVMFFSLSCGLFNGGLFMIGPSMCMHYVENKYYSFAIASRYFLYAPLSFTQAPFIGYFRDTLQSYDGLLYILIGVCFLSAILSLLTPTIIKCRDKR